MPVVEHYRKENKVVEVSPPPSPGLLPSPLLFTDTGTVLRTDQVDSSTSVDEVYAEIRKAVDSHLQEKA